MQRPGSHFEPKCSPKSRHRIIGRLKRDLFSAHAFLFMAAYNLPQNILSKVS